ncbi:MAG: hypothetical protein STSR0009_01290 [Methanoregula sp.]
MSHNERCKECKVRVQELLEKIDGRVITNYRIPVSTKPEDFREHPRYPVLNEIYASLQNHRGFTEFVKASYVDVDFFLPEQGLIVEFDESQHFTEPRKIALAHYPSDIGIGFSRETWMKHCDEIKAHDNDPPFRDEQRAWYDTMRDFIPEIKGFQPTVRLYSRDMKWCTLDPENANDVEQFKSCISDAQKEPFSIEVLCDSNPKLARIIISGSWEGNSNRAKSLLKKVAKKWPQKKRVDFLITPGAFVRFPWPDDFPSLKDNLFPCLESVESLRHAAQKYCHALLDERMRIQLAEHADYLTIGVDSRDTEKNNRYEVEFVALVDLKTNQYFWTGKSYPNTPQEHRLIRIADLSTHFVNLSMGKVMVLGCHDLKLFSNRGRTATRNEWRKKTQWEIDRLLEREQPEIVLQHPHTTDRSGSWISEWNELVYRFPSVKHYISAGLYYHGEDPCRSTLGDVLKNTKRGASIDFIVFSDSGVPIVITTPAQDTQKREQK